MAFIVKDRDGATLLTLTVPLDIRTAGRYYVKRCKVDSPNRKITIDSSPSANGSFAQDFDDHSWPISGGSMAIVGSSESDVRATFESDAANIKGQIGLELTIPNQTNYSSYPNCVCTAFELMRRPPPDLRTVIPNEGATTFRAYVAMEFVQLSK